MSRGIKSNIEIKCLYTLTLYRVFKDFRHSFTAYN
uniref:Uncharacterized protein LOC8260391 isoform X4 n=1 Tax=Rhizophora mucronata TaxID=61149 RepID=A0A2P2KLP5_RHIMU